MLYNCVQIIIVTDTFDFTLSSAKNAKEDPIGMLCEYPLIWLLAKVFYPMVTLKLLRSQTWDRRKRRDRRRQHEN